MLFIVYLVYVYQSINIDYYIECKRNDDDDVLDEYFLSSDDFRTYGDPRLDYFQVDKSLTGTTVIKFQPLGSIRKKKEKSKKQASISERHMLKGVVEKAVTVATQSILNRFNELTAI